MIGDPRFDGPGPDLRFQEALAAGRLVIARCARCGAVHPPERLVCARCAASPLVQVEPSGRGRVYSTTVIRRRPEQGGDYNLVIVELEEGVRLMSRVEEIAADRVRIGMAVTARIDREGDSPVLVFVPAAGDGVP